MLINKHWGRAGISKMISRFYSNVFRRVPIVNLTILQSLHARRLIFCIDISSKQLALFDAGGNKYQKKQFNVALITLAQYWLRRCDALG